MKKNITLSLFILLLTSIALFAAAPTVPSSNLSYTSLDGAGFTINFTKGNGAFRIVVMKEASAVAGVPVDGVEYVANSNFATAGTEFTAAGEYVVYKGTGASFSVSRLKPATTYHISVFEYNGTGINAQYLLVPLTGSQATVSAPTIQTSALGFTNVAGNSVVLNWVKGNGGRRMVLARKTAAVNGIPEDLRAYSYSPVFGDGNVINGENYVVYSGTGNQATINNLEPATTYHFAVFEFNGVSAPMYLKPAAFTSITTNAGPTQASSNLSFVDVEGNRLTANYSTGNGMRQLIIARKGAPVTAVPVNGTTYTGNNAFGQGTEIAPGEFVLYTSGTNKVFTNLDPASVYHFRIYDYDVTLSGQTYYLTTAFAVKSQSTAVAPTIQASGINFINVTGNAVTMKFTQGNGSYRLSVIKEDGPVDAIPVDLIKYNGNGAYGSGAQISPGNYALSNANGSTVNITNLTPGKTYHVAVFEFNGQNYPVYLKPAATSSISLPAQPTQPATNFFTNFIEGGSFRCNWTSGNGARRVVIAKKGSAVTARPADGTTYTADVDFGEGQEVAPGEFVILDGTFSTVDLENLEVNSTYHFAVFEYNPSATGPDYLTTSFLAATGTTAAAPATQVTALSTTNIQANQATISFTKGNGAGRLFIMRENAAVNVDPQDLVSYSAHTVFGTQHIGNGNYAVHKAPGTAAFTVTGLAPSTVYHVAAYEFNGSTGPVYLKPAGTFSFTTAAGAGVPTPTIAASNPSFTSVDGNKFTFNWTSGNGSNRMVVIKQGSVVNFIPVNASAYAANASFGSGTDLGDGQFVVYNGTSGTGTITNLQPGTTYHIAVFEFNGTGTTTRYLTSSFLAASGATAAMPLTGSSNAAALPGNQTITINFTAGAGSGRMVVMKEGSAVSATPVNLSAYPANNVFGNGAQIASGQYVVYAGAGNSLTVTGLTPNKTYHFSIFEYNGIDAPVYNTVNVLSGSATTTAALPVKWLYFTAKEGNNGNLLEWGTTNEQNVSHFVIERSPGNTQFIAIDSVQANGTAGINHYRFTDRSTPASAVYYRIRQVDMGGRSEYSKLIRMESAGRQTALSIYPNLVQNTCRVQLPQGIQQGTLLIFDTKGMQVKSLEVQNGDLIQLGSLPAGTYNIVLRGTGRFSTRIVKL